MRHVHTHKRHLSRALQLAIFTGIALTPERSFAYSDRERFELPPGAGGGGGRYFTGSPIDGYTCSVCHRGGANPTVSVRGLPVDGYVAGEVYDVELAWDDAETYHALQLEMVDRNGQATGDLQLFEEKELDSRERCGALASEERASYVIERPGRRVLGVRNCDASAMRFRFTAPEDEDVAFAGGVVRVDNSATVDGDGFVSLNVVLKRADHKQAKPGGSCALSERQGSARWPLYGTACALIALAQRRRRVQR